MIEWLAKRTTNLLPRTKIVRKLFVGYVLIVLLPLTLLAYFLYNQVHDRFLDEYLRSRQELIEQANGNLKVELTQVESVYQLFQYNSYVLEYLNGDYHSEIDTVYNLVKNIRPIFSYVYVGTPHVVEIILYCSDPDVLALGPEFRRMDELADNQEAQSQVLELGPGQGIWIYDLTAGDPLPQLSYYQKVYNKEFTKQIGIMEVKITDEIIGKLIAKVKTTPNDHVVMMSEQGETLYSDLSADNHQSMGNRIRVEPLGIDVISYTTQKDVNLKEELRWLALGGAGCLLLLSMIYYWIATSLTRRILKLARHMRSVDSTNFTAYVDSAKDKDEIHFLASSYNAMLVRIDELVNTVHREELLRKEADYKVLQAQIRPHFLYNTLESIRMMAEMKDAPEVADFTHTFGKLIRYSLSNNQSETTLKNELDHVRDFLVIHKNRVGERLSYEINIHAPINGFVCPRFILQPLVENSIVHGLSERRKQGWIHIRIDETDSALLVEIADNGVGIGHERLRTIQEILAGKQDLSGLLTDSSGIGIYNVHERIKSFFGEGAGLSYTSYPGQGTICIVRMSKGARTMLKLLVVDDETLILEGLRTLIARADTAFRHIETAIDGIEALEKLQAFAPDLMITDIHMPEMNGLELIKRAKEQGLCQQFIVLTGYDEFGYARQALRYQVLDYLLKPIDKEELLSTLEDAARIIQMNKDARTVEQHEDKEIFPAILDRDQDQFSEQVNRIIHYIHLHYATDLSLEQIAQHTGLNPSYVSAIFKKETGINFIPYLHSCRIHKAQQLMSEQPRMPLDMVALQVGYENPRQFFKVFKRYSGITPGQFRDVDGEAH